MYMMAVNHDVEDYDRWKAVYDEVDQGEMGARFGRVNRNVDNPLNITVVHGFDTLEAAREFASNPALKEAMGRAGAVGAPRFEFYEEVEHVAY
jgi:hypothetical protein